MIGIESVYVSMVTESLTSELKSVYFHPEEIAYCNAQEVPMRHYAMRYCGKRAIFKALGLLDDNPSYLDVKILRSDGGRPNVVMLGATSLAMRRMGFGKCALSMDSLGDVATASTTFER